MTHYDEKIERAIIGSLIQQQKKIGALLLELKPSHFYFEKNKIIIEAIISLFNDGKKVDLMTLSEKLSDKLDYLGGITYIVEIIENSLSLRNPKEYLNILKEKYRIRIALETVDNCSIKIKEGRYENSTELVSELSAGILELSKDIVSEKTDILDNLEEFSKRQEQYAINANQGKKTIGVPTGFRNLDRLIDGYQPEHLITLSAGSSVGKSSMAINLAYQVLKQGLKVVIFSLEMSKVDMISKIIGIHINKNPRDIMKEYGDDEMYAKQKPAKAWLSMQQLVIYSDLDNIDEIALAMRNEESKGHVSLFILDYIQNVSSEKYRDEYGLLTNAIKVLQKTNRNLKTTLLVLSQISIDTRKSTATQTVEGKGTGAIRNASNVFIYMKRDLKDEEEVNNIIQNGSEMPLLCVINKNRHGSIGAFKLNMDPVSGVIYEPY